MKENNLNLETLGFIDVKKSDKKVFIALTADYRNIGDIAITIAQRKILSNTFPDRKIIEIPMINAFKYENYIKEILNNDDLLTLIGGGNMGNVYLSFEERRRFIIDLFKNNKAISFPQSIDFLETDDGKKEFKKSIDAYSKNQNLTILAREQKSFDIMKKNFRNNVLLVPDSVFYLQNQLDLNHTQERKNITLCLRNDKEKITNPDFTNDLKLLLMKHNYKNISIIDTIIENPQLSSEDRILSLKTFLNTHYYTSKVIVTDRLHGMIFASITNTPCIVFDNSNKKISSTYNTWLKNQSFIKFMDNYNEEEFLSNIKCLTSLNANDTNTNLHFESNFKELVNLLKK